jgi:hypothetical protein
VREALDGGNDMRGNRYGAVANTTAHAFLNMTGVQPIVQSALHPTAITLPTRHKALQRLMRVAANLDTIAQLSATNRAALVTVDEERDGLDEDQWARVTHFVMTQYGYKAAVQRFEDGAETAVHKELLQIHNHDAFAPQHVEAFTFKQRKRALESIMTVKHKHDDSLKGRLCADGRKQRGTMRKDDAASPTVCTDSVFITAAIEAAERRKVSVVDLPGAYLSANMDNKEEVLMVMRGRLAEMMAIAAPEVYRPYVKTDPNGKAVLYVKLCKALYSCLKSALLFYKKLWTDLRDKGFALNPYDPCVCNKMITGKQMTITWHVDHLKISHASQREIDGIVAWLETIYGTLDAS